MKWKLPILVALVLATPTLAAVRCQSVDPLGFIRNSTLAMSRKGYEVDPINQPDGYFRTLALKAHRIQTIQDNYTAGTHDGPEDYTGLGLKWTFYNCSSSYTSGSNITYDVGKLVVEPVKTSGQLSKRDRCLTFHPTHKQFGIASCSFIDDDSQGLQTFATNVGYNYRFIGPPTDLDAFNFFAGYEGYYGESGWEVYPRLNRKNNEWTVMARFSEAGFDANNGFASNSPYGL